MEIFAFFVFFITEYLFREFFSLKFPIVHAFNSSSFKLVNPTDVYYIKLNPQSQFYEKI